MIPKIIHYCWFGRNEKPESFFYCLATWKKYLPDYEIIEWNESNFDIENSCEFVRQAAQQKKWAFVSDYVRITVLKNLGGIYFDTDVEVKNSLDCFLEHQFFLGLEIQGYVSTALLGSEKNHPLLSEILDYYKKTEFKEITNNLIISSMLENHYNFDVYTGNFQLLKDGIVIYPSAYFTLDLPINYASHHFSHTWQSEDNKNNYKNKIHLLYYLNKVFENNSSKKEINNMINNQKLFSENFILDNIPLRNIIKYLYNRFLGKY